MLPTSAMSMQTDAVDRDGGEYQVVPVPLGAAPESVAICDASSRRYRERTGLPQDVMEGLSPPSLVLLALVNIIG